MSLHWEFALNHASGTYISFLGDDDAIFPNGLETSRAILESESWPSTLSSLNAEYHWPSSPVKFHSNIYTCPTGASLLRSSSMSKLGEVLSGSSVYNELPMIYKGWVKHDLLNELKLKTGAYFRSCQPDIYMAVACSLLTNNYLTTSKPLFVEGISGYSNGAQSMHGSRSSDRLFFLKGSVPFHKDVPFCPASSFLVLESLFQCRDAGLLSTDIAVDYIRICDLALRQAKHMDYERYEQCAAAVRELAVSTSVIREVGVLMQQNGYTPATVSPFPPTPAWMGLKWNKYPCVSVRAAAAGCHSMSETLAQVAGSEPGEIVSPLALLAKSASNPEICSCIQRYNDANQELLKLRGMLYNTNKVKRSLFLLKQLMNIHKQ